MERWQRQIKTDYDNLSENEKNSDRNQVKKIVIKNFHKNNKPKGIVVAGFGAIGKTWLGEHYPNIIDMESGFYAHINKGFEQIDVEKRKEQLIALPIHSGQRIILKPLLKRENIMMLC